MPRRYRPTTYAPAPPPQPLRGYAPSGLKQYSGPVFWAWFDALTPADRRRLNDYAGPNEGFRDLVETIALEMLERQRQGT